MIAGICNGRNVPDGMKLFEFPESDWEIFSAKGALPNSLQQLNTDVWQKWYISDGQEYEPTSNATVEYYSEGNNCADDYECGI